MRRPGNESHSAQHMAESGYQRICCANFLGTISKQSRHQLRFIWNPVGVRWLVLEKVWEEMKEFSNYLANDKWGFPLLLAWGRSRQTATIINNQPQNQNSNGSKIQRGYQRLGFLKKIVLKYTYHKIYHSQHFKPFNRDVLRLLPVLFNYRQCFQELLILPNCTYKPKINPLFAPTSSLSTSYLSVPWIFLFDTSKVIGFLQYLSFDVQVISL